MMDAGRGSHHVCSYLCHHVYSHADIVRYHLLHVVKVALPPGDASSHAMQLRNTHARARTHAQKSRTRIRLYHHPRPRHTHGHAQSGHSSCRGSPHAREADGSDSRRALRAVTPPASCWSARLLRSCGQQQTARQRTHRSHVGEPHTRSSSSGGGGH